MSRVFSCARTQAGIQRLARERQAPALTVEARKAEAAPVVAPKASNVVRLVIPRTGAQQIIADIAHKHGLTYADILSPSHRRKLVVARHDAIAAVKNAKPVISLEQLGRIFRRDYSSIRHALVQRGLA
jgi:chromosomal replication initiation ATPase DnaA